MAADSHTSPFVLPDLPYAPDAFGAVISARTFSFHHGKHHKTYVDNANALAEKAGLGSASVVEIVRRAKADAALTPLFNNAAQSWNHSFYWNSLSPNQQRPEGELAKQITQSFGGWDKFAQQLTDAAVGRFASGWAWLVAEPNGALAITTTMNADTPIADAKQKPLLTIDVWEHAYYLDHQNLRKAYVEAVVNNHLNWTFAAQNLESGG
ncbi:MAG: superoxide dismutase [Terricaulis silvestris]